MGEAQAGMVGVQVPAMIAAAAVGGEAAVAEDLRMEGAGMGTPLGEESEAVGHQHHFGAARLASLAAGSTRKNRPSTPHNDLLPQRPKMCKWLHPPCHNVLQLWSHILPQ
jgi:hypothetical protein